MPLTDTIREIENSPFIDFHEFLDEDNGPLVRRALDEITPYLYDNELPNIPALEALGWPIEIDVDPETLTSTVLLQTAKGYLVIG